MRSQSNERVVLLLKSSKELTLSVRSGRTGLLLPFSRRVVSGSCQKYFSGLSDYFIKTK